MINDLLQVLQTRSPRSFPHLQRESSGPSRPVTDESGTIPDGPQPRFAKLKPVARVPVQPAGGIETPGPTARDRPATCSAFPTPPWTGARARRQAGWASSSSIPINRRERVYRGSAALRNRAVVEPATPRRAFLNAATAAGRSTSRETAPARRSTTARTLTRLLLETRSTATPTVPSANPSRRTAIRIRDRVGPECSACELVLPVIEQGSTGSVTAENALGTSSPRRPARSSRTAWLRNRSTMQSGCP